MTRRMLALLLSATVLAACVATLGPAFKPTKAPYGMAMVYVYAEDVGLGSTVMVDHSPDTSDSTNHLTMVSGGYYPYAAPVGDIRFFTVDSDGQVKSCVRTLLVEGRSYYIKVKDGEDFTTVSLIESEAGLNEIGTYRRLPSDYKSEESTSIGVRSKSTAHDVCQTLTDEVDPDDVEEGPQHLKVPAASTAGEGTDGEDAESDAADE